MENKTNLLKGKRGLVMGVANNRSIAWGIAKACCEHGAEIALSYQGEAIRKRVIPLSEELNSALVIECDVTNTKSIDEMFEKIGEKFESIDFLVHAVAFSDKDELKGRYVETTQENFINTMNISCYSFTSVSQKAEKVMPHYNVMGVAKSALETSVRYLAKDLGKQNIRVNAISAGPIKTLAASGIGDFRYILKWNEYNSPLKRNVSIDEVGGSAVYLISDLSSGVTGEVHHVDSGYNIIGMKDEEAPDISVVED
jgi:enoyl-[acyl-carrier protein] reductase I